MSGAGRWTALCLAASCLAMLHCVEQQQQQDQGAGTEFIYGPDGQITIIAREGARATVGFVEILGCHVNCTGACSRAIGTGYVLDAADVGITPNSPDPNFSPRIDFQIGVPVGTDGLAISHCALWTQRFVVEPRRGSDATRLTGDFSIDCVVRFDASGANNYAIDVELGLDSGGPQEAVEQSYCRRIISVDGTTVELCNDPPDAVENLSLQIADFTFETNVVYRAYVQMLASISGGEESDFGGEIEGHLSIHGLAICIDCE